MGRKQVLGFGVLALVVFGCPNPIVPGLDPSVSTVETGHASGTTGLVFVNVDNPDTRIHVSLHGVTANGIAVNQEVTADLSGKTFNNFNSDFFVNTTGGEAVAAANGLSTGGSVADHLLPWIDQTGDFLPSQDMFFDTHGIRVGYTPLTIQLGELWPNFSAHDLNLPIKVQLDPNVLLVPVEAVVFVSGSFPQVNVQLDAQLEYWDLVSSVTQIFTEAYSNGDLEAVHRTWGNWVDRQGSLNLINFQERFTPDSVWQKCGIQFRLVNFFAIPVDDEHAAPTDKSCSIDANQPLFQNVNTLMSDARHMSGTLRIVLMQRCTCPSDILGSDTGREVGGAGGVACFSFNDTSSAFTPSHEIGHSFGLCDAYCTQGSSACAGDCNANCATGGPYSLMCGAGLPTQHECDVARVQAATYAGFWKR